MITILERNTVKSWIESATLFKIWLFWRDSNRVRIVFEWGLYFLIYFKSSKNLTKLAVNSSKMMKNIANLIWFFYLNIELTIYYIAKSCLDSIRVRTLFKCGFYSRLYGIWFIAKSSNLNFWKFLWHTHVI